MPLNDDLIPVIQCSQGTRAIARRYIKAGIVSFRRDVDSSIYRQHPRFISSSTYPPSQDIAYDQPDYVPFPSSQTVLHLSRTDRCAFSLYHRLANSRETFVLTCWPTQSIKDSVSCHSQVLSTPTPPQAYRQTDIHHVLPHHHHLHWVPVHGREDRAHARLWWRLFQPRPSRPDLLWRILQEAQLPKTTIRSVSIRTAHSTWT